MTGGPPTYTEAVFNLAHGLDQMLFLRPRNKFEEFPGLYLVGGGTHPGSGLPTIFESGRITSKILLADMGIHPEERRGQLVPVFQAPGKEGNEQSPNISYWVDIMIKNRILLITILCLLSGCVAPESH